MPKRPGEMTVSEAAEALEVDPSTVRNWAREAVSGGQSRLQNARRHPINGRYFLDEREVRQLLSVNPSEFF